jgi:hypothetical protein
MKVSIYLTAILISSLLLISCSDIKDDINSPGMLSLHKQGILDNSSADWHGHLVGDSKNKLNECRSCHGKNLTGLTDAPSCTTCHTVMNLHTDGFSHVKIMSEITWDLSKCRQCHGEDYAGTATSPSCLTCHTQDHGPQACNTCHGDASGIAPPSDLSGNTSTTAKGVGAHTQHVMNVSISDDLNCSTCHPSFPGFAAHINGLPAEIEFSDAALYQNAVPAYNADGKLECSNTYCHGNFEFLQNETRIELGFSEKVVGNNKSVVWNEVGTGQAECGSCHGLPPAGHSNFEGTVVSVLDCYRCHSLVVDNTGKIINKTLHINGEAN